MDLASCYMYTLDFYSNVCQLFLNETGKKLKDIEKESI